MLNIAERWQQCNNFNVAACSGGNVFNNATGSSQTTLLLPCYFFAKFVEILGCYHVFYI